MTLRPEIEQKLGQSEPYQTIAFRFVFVFSRYEFALKMAGFIRRKEGPLEACWDSYAQCLPILSEANNRDLNDAVSQLFDRPPRIQRRYGDSTAWCAREAGDHNNATLFQFIRDIRNNLFHGGKVPFREGRDDELLRSSLVILSECLPINKAVYDAFCSAEVWVSV